MLGGKGGNVATDRGTQWFVLAGGVACLWLGVNAVFRSYSAGFIVFPYKRSEFTGEIALFLICSLLVVGAGLVGTAVRNLERPRG